MESALNFLNGNMVLRVEILWFLLWTLFFIYTTGRRSGNRYKGDLVSLFSFIAMIWQMNKICNILLGKD